jgi:high-affinity nickel permease
MFGLDDAIASLSDGSSLLIVIGIAVLLGVRHATDPDHMAAVTGLVTAGGDRGRRPAAELGLAWGLGHAATLFALGLPVILFRAYLPESVLEIAEVVIGLVIVFLALWLLARWRSGLFHVHAHGKRHPDSTGTGVRSRFQAFGIGLVHGVGGSGGVGVLLLSSIGRHGLAVAAMAAFALLTALSMTVVSGALGHTLAREPVRRSLDRLIPVLATASLAFGIWYALGALQVAPYYF